MLIKNDVLMPFNMLLIITSSQQDIKRSEKSFLYCLDCQLNSQPIERYGRGTQTTFHIHYLRGIKESAMLFRQDLQLCVRLNSEKD